MSKKAVGCLIILCVLFFSVVQSQTKIVQKKGLYEVFINGKNQGELNSEKNWMMKIHTDGKIEMRK